jgi:hypothetical protein
MFPFPSAIQPESFSSAYSELFLSSPLQCPHCSQYGSTLPSHYKCLSIRHIPKRTQEASRNFISECLPNRRQQYSYDDGLSRVSNHFHFQLREQTLLCRHPSEQLPCCISIRLPQNCKCTGPLSALFYSGCPTTLPLMNHPTYHHRLLLQSQHHHNAACLGLRNALRHPYPHLRLQPLRYSLVYCTHGHDQLLIDHLNYIEQNVGLLYVPILQPCRQSSSRGVHYLLQNKLDVRL